MGDNTAGFALIVSLLSEEEGPFRPKGEPHLVICHNDNRLHKFYANCELNHFSQRQSNRKMFAAGFAKWDRW